MPFSRRALLPLTLSLPLAACAPGLRSPAVPLPAPPAPVFPQPPVAPVHREPPSLSAASALVFEPDTGKILLEHAPDQPRPVASTTKIMTALVTLERVAEDQLDAPFRVGVMRPRPGETLMGLRTGEQVTVRQLLYGLMLPSGNDAADALATHVAGSRQRFVDLMNARAASLGLARTTFMNPSGLDQEGSHSTARDLAHLAVHAMRHPTFAGIAGKRTHALPPAEDADSTAGAARTLVNNSMPIHLYPGVTGVKPGWTPEAGTCQVISASLEDRTVIAVVLKTDPSAQDIVRILDWVFDTTSTLAPPDHDRTTVRGVTRDGQPWAFFAATHERVSGPFLRAFDQLGGLDELGYPVGPHLTEHGRPVQYFQRARLEHTPRGAIALSRLSPESMSASQPAG